MPAVTENPSNLLKHDETAVMSLGIDSKEIAAVFVVLCSDADPVNTNETAPAYDDCKGLVMTG